MSRLGLLVFSLLAFVTSGCGLILDLGAPEEPSGLDGSVRRDVGTDARKDIQVTDSSISCASGPCTDVEIVEGECVTIERCEPHQFCTAEQECHECLINEHCGEGGECDAWTCEAGVCHPPQPCDDGSSCTDDACVNGACVARVNCPLGQRCAGDVCIEIPDCASHTDCLTEGRCGAFCTEEGVCEYDDCAGDVTECSFGYCNDATCEMGLDDTACGGELICTVGRCSALGSCEVQQQRSCGASDGCNERICVPGMGCRTRPNDAACSPGEVCGPRGVCIVLDDRVCLLPCVAGPDPCTGVCATRSGMILRSCRETGFSSCEPIDSCHVAFCHPAAGCQQIDICALGVSPAV